MTRFARLPSLPATGLIVGMLCMASGCAWFRSNSDYENSPESRPLAVPPDLDTPATDASMQVPQANSGTQGAVAAPSGAFAVADEPGNTWRRLGLALERIEGVSIAQKAEALSAYNVVYSGEEFLIRVVADGAASRIEAVGGDGSVTSSGAAGRLLGLLKSRLG